MSRKLIILLSLLWVAIAQAQVIQSITDENLKIPRGMKPAPKPSNATQPDVTINTDTPYFNYIDSAQTAIDEHRYVDAERYLLQAVVSDPDNPNNSLLVSNIATIERYNGNYAEAIKNYNLALDMTPNAVTVLLNRAAVYVEIDSLNLARADYLRVRELDDLNTEARYSLGMLELNDKNYKQAEDYFYEIRYINPNSGLFNEGMGLLCKAQGNYKRAAEYFTDLIKIKPDVTFLAHRADCYLAMKRLRDAEADIRTALEQAPTDGYLYLLRAKLNKLRFAHDDMERDIKLATENGVPEQYARKSLEGAMP